ncbi:MAG: dihydrolipoyl dehydrogenase [Firmicutes bacterium]|nr:dihydrolipoyl dehydrogenase [Bacillota bacterium]
MIEVILDSVEGGGSKAKLIRIYKKEGEAFRAGDTLFELESAKNNMKISATVDGIISRIEVVEGEEIKAGETLTIIKKETVKDTKEEKSINDDEGQTTVPAKKKEEPVAKYDIAILGGGPGGYVAAIKAAQLGAKVALIEKDKLGGTCLNWGCIPTKALVRSAEIYKDFSKAEENGFNVPYLTFNWSKIQSRKDKIVKRLVGGIEHLMDVHGIDVFNTMGSLVDKNTIELPEDKYSIIKADNIIIATGSKPSGLPIEGADLPGVINSKAALSLEELPPRMVVVGGGIIGMEFAFILAAFEVKVTVVEYLDQVVESCDSEISQELTRLANKKGVRIVTGARVEKIGQGVDQSYSVFFNKDGKEHFATADKVLMAVGRQPVYQGINPVELGLELNENGGIKVNDRMETNIPGIYAIGDVTNKIQLAHVASHQGVVAVKNIMGDDSIMDYTVVPSAIFTDPEIAEVGICQRAAEKKGIDFSVGRFPFMANGKALTAGHDEGFIKLISEKGSGQLIGGSIIGTHATDLLAEVTLAVKNKLTVAELTETIHAHPTTAEVIHEAALDLAGGALHYSR